MKPLRLSSQLDIYSILSPLDFIIFTVVLLATCAAVIYGFSLRKKGTKASLLEYLLMGRQLTLPLFVTTLVATWYGNIFSVTQQSFEKGIYNIFTQGIFWYVAYLIFALFIVEKVRDYNVMTLCELVEKMFGPKSAKVAACFNFFDVVPIAYAMSLGLFLHMIFGGDIATLTFLGVLGVVAYSLFGGFRAVVFSDVVQFCVMCLSVVIVIVFSYKTFGGISFLRANLPAHFWSFSSGERISDMMVWLFVALSTLVDPCFYQRCFAASSTTVARRGTIISTVVWFFFDICTTFGGMYARAVLPEASSSQAYIIYALQILPPGVRGFVLAGVLATILSTLDSYLFTAGTIISYDLLPKRWRNNMAIHHIAVVCVGALAALLAGCFDGKVYEVCRTIGSYAAACLFLPMMVGFLFPKKITDTIFSSASVLGAVMITLWPYLHPTWASFDKFYAGSIATAVVLCVGIGVRESADENRQRVVDERAIR
jgi:solute:Na+ symporter, SSS family